MVQLCALSLLSTTPYLKVQKIEIVAHCTHSHSLRYIYKSTYFYNFSTKLDKKLPESESVIECKSNYIKTLLYKLIKNPLIKIGMIWKVDCHCHGVKLF